MPAAAAVATAALATISPTAYLDHLAEASGSGGTDEAFVMTGNETAGQTMANFTLAAGKRDFVFDRTDVRVIFVTLYSMVFCCCFFGKCLFLLNSYILMCTIVFVLRARQPCIHLKFLFCCY